MTARGSRLPFGKDDEGHGCKDEDYADSQARAERLSKHKYAYEHGGERLHGTHYGSGCAAYILGGIYHEDKGKDSGHYGKPAYVEPALEAVAPVAACRQQGNRRAFPGHSRPKHRN